MPEIKIPVNNKQEEEGGKIGAKLFDKIVETIKKKDKDFRSKLLHNLQH